MKRFMQLARGAGALLVAVVLSACGGGSDPFFQNPGNNGSGPAPTSPFGTTVPVQRNPVAALPAPVRSAPQGPRVLVLYDAPEQGPYGKLGLAYAIMVQNLLGHFDAAVELKPTHQYQSADVNTRDATFYIGWDSAALPPSFLQDVATTSRRVIWLRSNLDQLASAQGAAFETRWGLRSIGLRGFDPGDFPVGTVPSFFSTVHYKNLAFLKSAKVVNGEMQAAPTMFRTEVLDNTKARVHAAMSNPSTGESAPYVVESGNFWFVADLPFDYMSARDRYTVFADLLHDMLGIDHPEDHQAMVRFEDVDAKVNPEAFTKVVNYLHSRNVPFSMAVIPHYKDPFGAQSDGVPADIPMAQATNLRLALDYGLARGGDILQHGTTHQYGDMRNPETGASGIDYEFWDVPNNRMLPGDSVAGTKDRINGGLRQMLDLGFTPLAWETPHYTGSPSTLQAVSEIYQTAYQRHTYFTSEQPVLELGKDFMLDQFFPYVIHRDRYGIRVLPENLGNLQYLEFDADEEFTSREILENAKYQRVVRDGFASFFFHPFLAMEGGAYDGRGYRHLTEIVEGLTAMGYRWVSPSRLPASP
jgi:uncharacterized protein YdaL